MINLNLSEKILKNHEDFVAGKINYLPFKPLGNFTTWMPGLMRGDVTCFTGTPASSKTSLVKKLIIHDGIEWATKENKNFHCIYVGLEEAKSQFLYSLLSYQGFVNYGLQYNIKDFESIGRTIDKNDIGKIGSTEKIVEKMLSYISYYTSTYNSYGIWRIVRDFAQTRGTFFYKEKPIHSFDENESWDHYVSKDPEEFVVVVIDHLLLTRHQKNEKDQAEAIWNTVEYLRSYAANKLNYSVVVIHHQNADSENQDSRREGQILPTENGLARNKEVARSYLNLIGIANPNKANQSGTTPVIRMWDNHNLGVFGNYLRAINILKSRYGESNVNDSVFFGGRTGWFQSLPPVGTKEYTEFLDKKLKTFK